MFQIAKPIFFICETPLHAGAGGGIGTELPIQREEHTRFPKIEASGIKGAFREVIERKRNVKKDDKNYPADLIAVFGHPKNGDEYAGALGLTDARLLLFPVRSRRGIFAWVTCPRVLKRFARDLEVSKANGGGTSVDGLCEKVHAALSVGASVTEGSIIGKDEKVFLEEYSIDAPANKLTNELGEALSHLLGINDFQNQFVVIPDDYFSDFVQNNTEIHTRIRIGDDGVVADGQLFTEEHLPAESVLYALTMAHPELKKGGMAASAILDQFEKGLPEIVQIGGNATLGKGIVRITKNLLQNEQPTKS
jgi:CRISPR-associated protein Cmr4